MTERGHVSPTVTSTAYGRESPLLTEITETPPDMVEGVEPDQNAFENHLQVRTEQEVEVFDQVRLNMDKAHEKQKESYRSRIKKGTKCYDIQGYLGGSQQSSPVGAVGRSTTEIPDALHFTEAQRTKTIDCPSLPGSIPSTRTSEFGSV
ncbi:uncharacterized protein ACWYII_021898 [Salvelinus alpinus]